MSASNILGTPAVKQVLTRLHKSEHEENQLSEKIQKNCVQFDHSKTGALTEDEFFNVIKTQNKIPIEKDELKTILEPLPRTKEGKIKITDFFSIDIHSPSAFNTLDRNKDGFISKGELKLSKKSVPLKDIEQCIKDNDLDKDGVLNLDEFQKSGETARKK